MAKTDSETPKLFIVKTSAMTNDGPVSAGEIAMEGAKILLKYPLLFRPLAITYQA
jgi:hypothetical protein